MWKNIDENKFERKVNNRCKDCLDFNSEFYSKILYKKLVDNSNRARTSSERIYFFDKVNKNHNFRTLLVGPSFPGKTYRMFKLFSRFPDQDVYIFIKTPPEFYSNSKIKKITEEMKLLNEY